MNITFVEFLWLIHWALSGIYAFEILFYLANALRHRKLFARIKNEAPEYFQPPPEAERQAASTVLFVHVVAYSIAVNAVPILYYIFAASAFFAMYQNEKFKPIIKQFAPNEQNDAKDILKKYFYGAACFAGLVFIGLLGMAMQENGHIPQGSAWVFIAPIFIIPMIYRFYKLFQKKPETVNAQPNSGTENFWREQANFENEFNRDDQEYDFKESAFKSTPPPPEPTPRGYDKRHPDDAKLWAYVDDPDASDQERKTALDKIIQRQNKRNGKATKTKQVATRK